MPATSYYLTFSRIPTLGLEEWCRAFDDFAHDGVSTVVLWIGGGFRSRKYPVTWQYNADHRNIEEDFVGELIDYAHTIGIRVLLGFTPFQYDGVNQFAFERPDLKAIRPEGTFARMQGIHCKGYGLNPAKADAQAFMLDYVREMYFDFYPQADGMLIESADIDISSGGPDGERFYELEYGFARQISQEAWKHDPNATIIVYPQYFTGEHGGPFEYDPRWTLVFTPHSAFIDPAMISLASSTLYSDLMVISELPELVRRSFRIVRDHGIDGYFPSHEFFTYTPQRPENGDPGIVGRPLHPFGLEVLPRDRNPYGDPLVAVNRGAVREFRLDPELPEDEFRARVGADVFGKQASEDLVADLFTLHDFVYRDKSIFTTAPLMDPLAFADRLEQGRLSEEDLRAISDGLGQLPAIAQRFAASPHPAAARLAEHAQHALWTWGDADRALLSGHLR
ncbi:MAG TPA: hypothetical protein VHC49_13680 [Mycobacteriales bacterium]|nr:hypothetical protein [Mycobacteriales bacterium]